MLEASDLLCIERIARVFGTGQMAHQEVDPETSKAGLGQRRGVISPLHGIAKAAELRSTKARTTGGPDGTSKRS